MPAWLHSEMSGVSKPWSSVTPTQTTITTNSKENSTSSWVCSLPANSSTTLGFKRPDYK